MEIDTFTAEELAQIKDASGPQLDAAIKAFIKEHGAGLSYLALLTGKAYLDYAVENRIVEIAKLIERK